jgi:chromosome segregation ATPase
MAPKVIETRIDTVRVDELELEVAKLKENAQQAAQQAERDQHRLREQLEAEIAKIEKDGEKLLMEISDLEAKQEEMGRALEKARHGQLAAERKYATVGTDHEDLKEQHAECPGRLLQQKEEAAALLESSLKKQGEDAFNEILRLKRDVAKYTHNWQEAKKRENPLQSEIQRLMIEGRTTQRSIKELQAQLRQGHERHADLTREFEQLTTEHVDICRAHHPDMTYHAAIKHTIMERAKAALQPLPLSPTHN